VALLALCTIGVCADYAKEEGFTRRGLHS
jgi:hypothetical protein